MAIQQHHSRLITQFTIALQALNVRQCIFLVFGSMNFKGWYTYSKWSWVAVLSFPPVFAKYNQIIFNEIKSFSRNFVLSFFRCAYAFHIFLWLLLLICRCRGCCCCCYISSSNSTNKVFLYFVQMNTGHTHTRTPHAYIWKDVPR